MPIASSYSNAAIIWIIGGPGSCKLRRIQRCLGHFPNWKVISAGELLWSLLSIEGRGHKNEAGMVKRVGDAMKQGDFVARDLIVDLIVNAIVTEDGNSSSNVVEGYFVTGFPRDVAQAKHFEERVKLSSMPFYYSI